MTVNVQSCCAAAVAVMALPWFGDLLMAGNPVDTLLERSGAPDEKCILTYLL